MKGATMIKQLNRRFMGLILFYNEIIDKNEWLANSFEHVQEIASNLFTHNEWRQYEYLS